jgi:hypothetical protein
MANRNTYPRQDYHAAREPQARADEIYRAFDARAPAPRVLEGEGALGYRHRVANDLKRHSATWRDVEVRSLPLAAFEVAEKQIYADAQREARAPSNVPRGQLVERIESDRTGRHITKFFGDPAACWDMFKAPHKNVIGIRQR